MDWILGPLSFPATHLAPPNNTQHSVEAHVSLSKELHFVSIPSKDTLAFCWQKPTDPDSCNGTGLKGISFVSLLKNTVSS